MTPVEGGALGGPGAPAELPLSIGLQTLASIVAPGDPDAVRYLMIERTAGGMRSRDLKEFATSFKEALLEGWPLQGPRTVLWCLLFVLAQTG
eukprot:13222551-Heterocapsa_arctica.AAC.1